MVSTNGITDRRTELAGIIAAALGVDPTTADVPMHPFPPAQVVTPCLWVDMPMVTRARPGGVSTTVAQFPVVAAFDGNDDVQTAAMDLTASRIWDAVNTSGVARVDSIDPSPLDIGGPNTRTIVCTITTDLGLDVLCHPSSTIGATPER